MGWMRRCALATVASALAWTAATACGSFGAGEDPVPDATADATADAPASTPDANVEPGVDAAQDGGSIADSGTPLDGVAPDACKPLTRGCIDDKDCCNGARCSGDGQCVANCIDQPQAGGCGNTPCCNPLRCSVSTCIACIDGGFHPPVECSQCCSRQCDMVSGACL